MKRITVGFPADVWRDIKAHAQKIAQLGGVAEPGARSLTGQAIRDLVRAGLGVSANERGFREGYARGVHEARRRERRD
jgi:hypothetical protein